MMKLYADGLGETLGGDVLAGVKPIYGSSKIWYVDSAAGTDAGTADSNQQHPFKTVSYAIGKVSKGDVVVLASSHAEVLSASVAGGADGVTIVGIGTTAGKPSASLTFGHANAVLNFSAVEVNLCNIYFKQSTATTSSAGNILTGGSVTIRGCCFESGAFDTKPYVQLDGSAGYTVRIVNSSFTSVDTQATPTAVGGLGLTAAGAAIRMELDGVTFDGGTKGYAGYAADLSAVAQYYLRGWNVSLLRGADVALHASTTGFLHVSSLTASGGGKVSW
jgi:hypothetical protein